MRCGDAMPRKNVDAKIHKKRGVVYAKRSCDDTGWCFREKKETNEI